MTQLLQQLPQRPRAVSVIAPRRPCSTPLLVPPTNPLRVSAGGQRDIFCGYASQFASTTAKVAVASQSSTGTAAKATDNTNAGQTGSGSAATKSGSTATSTGKAAANTNSAADLVLNAGSVLAAVAGVAAFIL